MYKRHPCAHCDGTGTQTTFEPGRFEARGAHIPHVVEMPCPTCGARMETDRDVWRCPVCASTRPFDRSALIDWMTGEYETAAGYERPAMGECPACGDRRGVMCGPDGERYCDECDEFYASRFSTEWFAYATWLHRRIDTPVEVLDRD